MEDNRIKITPDKIKLSERQIAQGNAFLKFMGRISQDLHPVTEMATAQIQGVEYRGKEILIDSETVCVDGELVKILPTFVVHGKIGNEVKIVSDVQVKITGGVPDSCQLQSIYPVVTAHDVAIDKKSLNTGVPVSQKSILGSTTQTIEEHIVPDTLIGTTLRK